ncbi:MAG: di-trans,poly-cis-decaprenylcistransferase [Thermofilum sp. ex4484_79]|nr:MAG: di-trans,poly-cis-decaprenylcistransferase [Thermofilum sp. ex4484_79]
MRLFRKVLKALGIYKLYEKLLESEVKSGNLPNHIALILDGNRRWAKMRNLPSWLGHEKGAKKVEEALDWMLDLGIKTVTLYVLSTENLKRDKRELEKLFHIISKYLDKALNNEKILKYGVKVKAIGNLSSLPIEIQNKIRALEAKTASNNERFLNIAIAYGGRLEIINATRKIVQDVLEDKIKVDEIDEKLFEKYLFTSHLPNPSPDLVIRTSGEERLSNFLLWQSAYSELIFLDIYWPDFRRIDLLRAIRTYQKRHRRFGL